MPKCGDRYCRDGEMYERYGGCITQEGVTEDFNPARSGLWDEEPWECPGPCDPQAWSVNYVSTLILEKFLRVYHFFAKTIYGDSYHWSLVKAIGLFTFGIRMMFNLSRSLQEECDKKKKCQEMKKKYPYHK